MRRALSFVVVALLASLVTAAQRAGSLTPAAVDKDIAVFFSPKGGCTDAIIDQINGARRSLDVQAYSFTSAPIAKAVVDAHKRGVKVRVVLDKSQRKEKYTSATFLFNAGVPTWIDDRHAIAHNKIMLVDGQTIITGSFNFTKGAEERNAENLLIITARPKLLAAYQENFEEHLEHAVRYEGLKAESPAGGEADDGR